MTKSTGLESPLDEVRAALEDISTLVQFHDKGFLKKEAIDYHSTIIFHRTRARDALALLSDYRAKEGWRTMDDPEIERIKRDGTKVLVLDTHNNTVLIAFWRVIERTEDRKWSDLSEKKRALMYANGGYWSAHWRGEKPMHRCPTHWQPLPPPPALISACDEKGV